MPNDPTCTECSDTPQKPSAPKDNGQQQLSQQLWGELQSQHKEGFAPENFDEKKDSTALDFNAIDLYKQPNESTPLLNQSALRNDEIASSPQPLVPPDPDLKESHWVKRQLQLIDQGAILTPEAKKRFEEICGGPAPVPPPEPDKTTPDRQGSVKGNPNIAGGPPGVPPPEPDKTARDRHPQIADNPAPSNPPSPDKTARKK